MENRQDDEAIDSKDPKPDETGEPHKYYYDDATGYEVYVPEASEEDDTDGP
jgi:hypothetical protein